MNRVRRWAAGIIAGVLFAGLHAFPCNAALLRWSLGSPDVLSLRPGMEYTDFDVTGDGVCDHLLVSLGEQGGFWGKERNRLKISINGVNAFGIDDPYYRGDVTARYDVKLCTVSQEKVFFFIRTFSQGEYSNFCRLYEYRNGKLEMALDLKDIYRDAGHYREYIDIAGIENDSIIFRWYSQLGACGGLNWLAEFTYSGNSLHPVKRICPVAKEDASKQWTASREFAVYATCSLQKEWFRVKKGDMVKITDVYEEDGRFYLHLKNEEGKEGWIPCPNEQSPYFLEAFYA